MGSFATVSYLHSWVTHAAVLLGTVVILLLLLLFYYYYILQEGINGEFQEKKADLQPKVVEIYESAPAPLKVRT